MEEHNDDHENDSDYYDEEDASAISSEANAME